jgi:hypothetical protein
MLAHALSTLSVLIHLGWAVVGLVTIWYGLKQMGKLVVPMSRGHRILLISVGSLLTVVSLFGLWE